MAIAEGYYDELHWTECKIESFEFIGCNLEVYIKSGLEIYGEHPFSNAHDPKKSCKAIFTNVLSSVRSLNEYDDNPNSNGFKGEKKIVDKLEHQKQSDINYEDYSIEGVWQNPESWLDWEILAENFYLDDLKE